MTPISNCPICKQHRKHKLHTKECSEKARSLGSDNSFIGAYKSKIDPRFLPEYRVNKQ